MPRAGGGGGMGGGGRSSGGRSMGGGMGGRGAGGRPMGGAGAGRSSGGRPMGGAGAGRSSGGRPMGGAGGGPRPGAGGPGRGPGMGPGMGPRRNPRPPRPPRRGFFGRFFAPGWFRRPLFGRITFIPQGCGCIGGVILLIIILALLIPSLVVRPIVNTISGNNNQETAVEAPVTPGTSSSSSDSSTGQTSASVSSTVHERVESNVPFDSSCVIDELGWFDDTAKTGASLQAFYDTTGVQPYIYFKAYDSSVTTESQMNDYAAQWYDDNIDNEITFLVIYFADEDTDNNVGYTSYALGYDIVDLMDDEAIDIFYVYLDDYWYSDLSTDDMIIQIFDSLAKALFP